MKKALFAFAAVAMGLCLASGANALTLNTGKVVTNPTFTGNHLTDPESVVGLHGLYAPSEPDMPTLRTAIATAIGGGAVVDYFDARSGTIPSSGYDFIFTWVNYPFFDAVGSGNNLADFADAGHTVILGSFCVYTGGFSISGRILTTGYCPVSGGFNHFSTASWTGDDSGDCLYTGVSTLTAYFRDILSLQSWGTAKGHYSDGEIVAAYNNGPAPAAKLVVYANGANDLDWTPDWPTMVANCALCKGPIANETTTWGAVKDLYR